MAKVPTVAIVGRPNVGKSALFNRLLRRRVAIVHDQPGVTRDRLAADFQLDDRRVTLIDTGGIGGAIGDSVDDQVQAEAQLAMQMAGTIIFVSEIAGTTRDAIDIPYRRDGKDFMLIDTAGIRPRSKHNTSVEVFSVMRSEKSIERADICALVVDAVDGVTAQDKKIAGLIQENEKPCLVVVNKLDLVKPSNRIRDFVEAVLGQVRSKLFFLTYAPIDVLSAHTRENLDRLFTSIDKVEEHSHRFLGTGVLNRLLHTAMDVHPPPLRSNRRLKLLYATQIDPGNSPGIKPPTFILFVNDAAALTDDYRRYLESTIREHLA